MALLAYSMMVRKIKKNKTTKSLVDFKSQEFEEKTVEEFFKTGYLRPEFENCYLKNEESHKKYPKKSYEVKNSYELPKEFFKFLISSPENSLKFIKNFHSDMASTTQELLNSMMMTSLLSVDFTSIATKAI